MIDEERDKYPALLALYHPFVRYTHFPVFQSEKYTYRFLGFGVVLTALSRLRWCTQQPISRGSLGVQWFDVLLLHPCFNTFSRGFTEEYSRRRFLFVRALFDGVFDRRKRDILAALSPLRLCGPCLFRRAGAGRVAVDFSRAIRGVRTWQNPTFKNLIKLNIQNAENLRKPIFRPARTCQNLTFENTTNYYIRSRSHPLGRWESGFCDCSII